MASRSDYERDDYRRRDYRERDDFDRSRYRDRIGDERGWWNRTRDEVASWLGDQEAERRRRVDDRVLSRDRDALRSVRAGDLMSRDVTCVGPGASIEYAAQMMRECDCGGLPVTDNGGRLIGMITDRDIVVRLVARGADILRARVEDCMSGRPQACHVDDPIEDCMRTMSRHQIRRLPIVDNRDRVVGIISQGDLARYAGMYHGYGERRALADVVSAVSAPN